MGNLISAEQYLPDGDQQMPVGAVMVVGGGIAGIQASLDLADQGFKVYLVEKKSAIGGHMAQLDKTFPTNDCAMCNISPKLVNTGRHANIEILTDSDVLGIDGEAGNFSVSLYRRPRYIDTSICIGCGDCAEVCPVSLPDLYEEGLKERKAAYRQYAQAVPTAFAIEKLGTAPCRDACPAGQRAQGYIALIAQGRYREALRVIKEDNPFPSVCGRTCHHPCEGKCTRALVDDSVGIMALKRFVVDHALAYGREPVEPAPRTRSQWVAVVGAGPAGLTAAHDLVKKGYGVTIYEALPVAGGMMRVGIPAHRLPKGVLQQDIDDILDLGVVLKTNSPIKDPAALLEQGYDAVCMATGISSRDHTLGLEGEEADGFVSAASFLRKVNLGEPFTIGERVAVVGGGITALDAAAVARRFGAEVYLALDRPRGELPAYHWEVAAVEMEGIHLLERCTATRILTMDGRITGIELAETGKGMTKDAQGRRRPKIKEGSQFTLKIDTVIGTVGQYSDLSYLEPRFEDLTVDCKTLAADTPGLFVVGGRKTGASYIIDAVALGHRVATSIDRYLRDEPLNQPAVSKAQVAKSTRHEIAQRIQKGEIQKQERMEPSLLPMAERVTSFREVVLGLTERQARTEAQRCLQCGICAECLACVHACGVDAIDHNMIGREEQIDVGAVILAPGYQIYRSELAEEYGYGRFPNVVTSLQFERLLSASGPTQGHVRRPADGKTPRRIAFLQCVGSRDQTHDYCSAVCCMYATKEAIIAKEHDPQLDVFVYFMDMRAFSKGYWRYFKRARDKYGIEYIRCRASNLHEDPLTHDLILDYQDEDGTLYQLRFDMVVLSVGMEISQSVQQLGRDLGVELDQYGFCSTVQFNPIETSRPGIYAVGPFREPKDIPDSVIEASGAAAAAATHISSARFSQTTHLEYPAERDISEEEPRIGLFVCHCGSNIAGFLDVTAVSEHAAALPHVIHAESNLYTCSQDSVKHIAEIARERNLNRIVIASCSPLTHGSLFQDSLRMAGLNPYLLEMANIRNHCSWVHSDNRQVATEKAKDLVRMAVARVALLEPQHTVDVPVQQSALVVGGGVAGMTAALSLADQGFPVHLVEKEAQLGGNLRRIYTTSSGRNPQQTLRQLVERVAESESISLHLNSQVAQTTGFKGNFNSAILGKDEVRHNISHGVTILATGAQEYRGTEYGYGTDPRIITQQELEGQLASAVAASPDSPAVAVSPDRATPDSPAVAASPDRATRQMSFSRRRESPDVIPAQAGIATDNVVMIQCIGPAEQYCSRICCTVALKNALAIKEINPDANIVILFKDIRAYGFAERLYTQCRQQGVIFVRYDDDHKPEVELNDAGSPIRVTVWDPILQRQLLIQPNLLVLSMPVVPRSDMQDLARLFKVPVDADGFFMEAHVKLRPVDFSTGGIFMAGMAHYPKLLDETMIQAQAAASRAAGILSKESLTAGGQVAVVDESLCTGCLTCVRVCPFAVPQIKSTLTGVGDIMGAAVIEAAVCQGCGTCVAECPARAIQLMHYTDAQLVAKVDALMHPPSGFIPLADVVEVS